MIISEHDNDPDKSLPQDFAMLRRDVWGQGEEELEFVVRFHTDSTSIQRTCERQYFQRHCPHGIFVVVPFHPMIVHSLESHPGDDETAKFAAKMLDMQLLKLMVEEERSFREALEQHGRNRHHH